MGISLLEPSTVIFTHLLDIVAKANIVRNNPKQFEDENLEIIQDMLQYELDHDLQKLNGKDHKLAKSKGKQFIDYISTA